MIFSSPPPQFGQVCMSAAPVGVWLGIRFALCVRREVLERLFLVGVAVTGAKLLWDGLRGAFG